MRPLVRSTKDREVRILRPAEFEVLRSDMEEDLQKVCNALLLTGMRYAELERFRDNRGWLEGRFIKLPKGSMLKVEAKQREREIRLSDMGMTLVPALFSVEGALLPLHFPWQDIRRTGEAAARHQEASGLTDIHNIAA